MGLRSFIAETVCWRPAVFLLIAYIFLLCSASNMAESNSCNGGCMNGGRMLLPNSIFGRCRCRCPAPFMGPKCQFMTKKRSQSLASGSVPPQPQPQALPDLASLLLARSKVVNSNSAANRFDRGDETSDWLSLWEKLEALDELTRGRGEDDVGIDIDDVRDLA